MNNAASYYPEGVAEGERVTLLFDVKTRKSCFGIPFFFTYYYDRLPYDLLIVASSADLGLKSIYIREVEIKYDDYNHFVTAASDIGESFTPVVAADRSTDAKTGKLTFFDTPATRARMSLPQLLTRSHSVTLRLTCFLFYNDNTSKKLIVVKELPLRKHLEIFSYRSALSL
ncbi:MAG TPA: hypothetical protein VK678_10620 [Bradyrhizobium sp.]|nr:hypothetical protein [Bradyrhizobium sp.]